MDSGGLKSGGVHWTPSGNESTSLRKGESTGVQWSLVESAEVQLDSVGEGKVLYNRANRSRDR